MIEVGAFEAKTRLATLLEQVSQGEEVLIHRRGKPVAKLVPVEQAKQQDVGRTITALRTHRVGMILGGLGWRELRDAGRR